MNNEERFTAATRKIAMELNKNGGRVLEVYSTWLASKVSKGGPSKDNGARGYCWFTTPHGKVTVVLEVSNIDSYDNKGKSTGLSHRFARIAVGRNFGLDDEVIRRTCGPHEMTMFDFTASMIGYLSTGPVMNHLIEKAKLVNDAASPSLFEGGKDEPAKNDDGASKMAGNANGGKS